MPDLTETELYYQTPLPAFSWYTPSDVYNLMANQSWGGLKALHLDIQMRATRPGWKAANYAETHLPLSATMPILSNEEALWLVERIDNADALGRSEVNLTVPVNTIPKNCLREFDKALSNGTWPYFSVLSDDSKGGPTVQLMTHGGFILPVTHAEKARALAEIHKCHIALYACTGAERLEMEGIEHMLIKIEEDRVIIRKEPLSPPVVLSLYEVLYHVRSGVFEG